MPATNNLWPTCKSSGLLSNLGLWSLLSLGLPVLSVLNALPKYRLAMATAIWRYALIVMRKLINCLLCVVNICCMWLLVYVFSSCYFCGMCIVLLVMLLLFAMLCLSWPLELLLNPSCIMRFFFSLVMLWLVSFFITLSAHMNGLGRPLWMLLCTFC